MYVFVRRQKKEIKNKKYFIIDPTLLGQGRHSVMINSVPSFFLVKRLCKRTWKAGANNLLFSILQCCGYFPSIFVFVGVQRVFIIYVIAPPLDRKTTISLGKGDCNEHVL